MSLTISSPAFAHRGAMPVQFTAEGRDVSPPLSWRGVPAGTRSLALIVDDPDAPDPARPQRTWVHWVLYNIPPSANGLAEAAECASALPQGTRAGRSDFGHAHYGGPNPPIGSHRYFFKLYALDAVLPELDRPDKATLELAMHGHVLEEASVVATYQRQG